MKENNEHSRLKTQSGNTRRTEDTQTARIITIAKYYSVDPITLNSLLVGTKLINKLDELDKGKSIRYMSKLIDAYQEFEEYLFNKEKTPNSISEDIEKEDGNDTTYGRLVSSQEEEKIIAVIMDSEIKGLMKFGRVEIIASDKGVTIMDNGGITTREEEQTINSEVLNLILDRIYITLGKDRATTNHLNFGGTYIQLTHFPDKEVLLLTVNLSFI